MSKTYHGLQSDFASTTYENINLTQKIKQLNKKIKKISLSSRTFFCLKMCRAKVLWSTNDYRIEIKWVCQHPWFEIFFLIGSFWVWKNGVIGMMGLCSVKCSWFGFLGFWGNSGWLAIFRLGLGLSSKWVQIRLIWREFGCGFQVCSMQNICECVCVWNLCSIITMFILE